MKYKLTIILLVAIVQPIRVEAQQDRIAKTALNSLYYELGGNAFMLFSINYERLITENWSVRLGYGNMVIREFSATHTYVVMGQYSIPLLDGSMSLDFGLGGVIVARDHAERQFTLGRVVNRTGLKPTGLFGTRWQHPAGGFMARVSVAPIYAEGGIAASLGLSFGYAW